MTRVSYSLSVAGLNPSLSQAAAASVGTSPVPDAMMMDGSTWMDWLGRKGRRCRQRSGFKRAGGMNAREGAAGKGASSRRMEGNNNTIRRCDDDDDDDDDWSATKTATALPRRQLRHCY